jgi:hypothetical protein
MISLTDYQSSPARIPLPYTKININVKVGVPNEEFGRRSEL